MATQVTNLKEFNREIDFFAGTIPDKVLALQKKIALDLLTKIVYRTPVGNPDLWQSKPPKGYVGGRARANWQVSVGDDPPTTDVDKPDPSGGSTLSGGIAQISSARPGGVIWLYNNLPYIVRLEYGWSKQAPSGMVRLSLSEVEAAFARSE